MTLPTLNFGSIAAPDCMLPPILLHAVDRRPELVCDESAAGDLQQHAAHIAKERAEAEAKEADRKEAEQKAEIDKLLPDVAKNKSEDDKEQDGK